MWRVLTVHLGGHSWVLEIVLVEGMLHSLVWWASHYSIGITRSRRMHRMVDDVIYVYGMCIAYRVQMLCRVGRNGLQCGHCPQSGVWVLG